MIRHSRIKYWDCVLTQNASPIPLPSSLNILAFGSIRKESNNLSRSWLICISGILPAHRASLEAFVSGKDGEPSNSYSRKKYHVRKEKK